MVQKTESSRAETKGWYLRYIQSKNHPVTAVHLSPNEKRTGIKRLHKSVKNYIPFGHEKKTMRGLIHRPEGEGRACLSVKQDDIQRG
jgi:hypothetical protein